MTFESKKLMACLMAAGLIGAAHSGQAQVEWEPQADEPAAQEAQDPWGAEPAEPQVQEEDPFGAPAEPQVQEEDPFGAPAEPAPELVQPEAAEPAPAADPAMEMQQIQMQLQQVSMQLQQIQEQALQVQEVMDAFEAYEAELRAKMLALSPESEDDIQAAEAMMDELREVTDPSMLSPEEAEEFQAKYMEFQELAQRLQPIEQQASMDPDMQDARAELEDQVMDAMRGVDPDAEQIMDEHEQLIERYMELEQQQQQRQMQQQPQMQQQMQPPQEAPQDAPIEAPQF